MHLCLEDHKDGKTQLNTQTTVTKLAFFFSPGTHKFKKVT